MLRKDSTIRVRVPDARGVNSSVRGLGGRRIVNCESLLLSCNPAAAAERVIFIGDAEGSGTLTLGTS